MGGVNYEKLKGVRPESREYVMPEGYVIPEGYHISGVDNRTITYEEAKRRANALWQEVLDSRARGETLEGSLDREAV